MQFIIEYKKSLKRAVVPSSSLVLLIAAYALAQTSITQFQFFLTIAQLAILLALVCYLVLRKNSK